MLIVFLDTRMERNVEWERDNQGRREVNVREDNVIITSFRPYVSYVCVFVHTKYLLIYVHYIM